MQSHWFCCHLFYVFVFVLTVFLIICPLQFYTCHMCCWGQAKSKLKRCYIQLQKTLTIWNSIIKRIEGLVTLWSSTFTVINYVVGKFGSSVASYFTFLRWLCALNLFLSLLMVFFVILPQVSNNYTSLNNMCLFWLTGIFRSWSTSSTGGEAKFIRSVIFVWRTGERILYNF